MALELHTMWSAEASMGHPIVPDTCGAYKWAQCLHALKWGDSDLTSLTP